MGGRSKPVDLATRSFEKQSDATDFFRAMLNRYRPGARVSVEDGLDLAALLERHTECVAKVGCGVSHFEVMMTEHGTQCFRIIRIDDSGTDFSFAHCISQRPPSRKQAVAQAFRRAVRFDLYKARDDFFTAHRDPYGLVSCAITGERISPDEAHMDHRPPMTFEVIVTTFLFGRGLSLDDVPLTEAKDDQVAPEITDAALSNAFRTYHSGIARLDIVRNTANFAQASRHRLKDSRISLS
jgi:hypothetical protein